MALHRAVALCIEHCAASEIAIDDGWYKTVVLTGGTSCLPGLPGMVMKFACLLRSAIAELFFFFFTRFMCILFRKIGN